MTVRAPLSTTWRLSVTARSPGAGDAVPLDRGRLRAGQPRHLPGVRREHGLHAEAFQDLQATGQVVQAVGVDRRAAAGCGGPGRRTNSPVSGSWPEPGPDGKAALARRELQDRVPGGWTQAAAAGFGQGCGHGFEHQRLQDRMQALRPSRRSPARPRRAAPRSAVMAAAPVFPGEPADDQQVPGAALVGVGRPWGDMRRGRRRPSAGNAAAGRVRRCAAGMPMSTTSSRPGELRAREDDEADFGEAEGDGDPRADARADRHDRCPRSGRRGCRPLNTGRSSWLMNSIDVAEKPARPRRSGRCRKSASTQTRDRPHPGWWRRNAASSGTSITGSRERADSLRLAAASPWTRSAVPSR